MSKTKEKVGSYIIKARSDGRGGARPFGLKPQVSKHFIGSMFNLGGKQYKVTTDGRINIPKKVMNDLGITGDDGRKRITMTFASSPDQARDEKTFGMFANKPLAKDKNRPNNWKVVMPRQDTKRGLKPKDGVDYNWSPAS